MIKITNKKAFFNYTILERLECGIALLGWEVKSIRAKKISIAESFVTVRNGELFWINAYITPLATVTQRVELSQTRRRKLLAHKREIAGLIGKTKIKGLTIVPLALYEKKGNFKIEIGVGRGKSKVDKRHAIKEREWKVKKQMLQRQTSK